jgi:hypothetical protein
MNPRLLRLCLLVFLLAVVACGDGASPTRGLVATQVEVHRAAVSSALFPRVLN